MKNIAFWPVIATCTLIGSSLSAKTIIYDFDMTLEKAAHDEVVFEGSYQSFRDYDVTDSIEKPHRYGVILKAFFDDSGVLSHLERCYDAGACDVGGWAQFSSSESHKETYTMASKSHIHMEKFSFDFQAQSTMYYGDDTTGSMTSEDGTPGSWYGRNQIWSVVNLEKSVVAPVETNLVSTPLPAGLPMLLAGVLGFGILKKRARAYAR